MKVKHSSSTRKRRNGSKIKKTRKVKQLPLKEFSVITKANYSRHAFLRKSFFKSSN